VRISNKTDYALRALFALVASPGDTAVSAREIAEKSKIPRKFLEQIMRELKEQGVVQSIPGKHGGYRLARPAAEISIGDVVRNFDGLHGPAPCACLDCSAETCPHESACHFRWLFVDIRDYAARLLDGATLESVYRKSVSDRSNEMP
jgi:Rrf2 family protein